jgi:ubiquitin C-terminal hydrolase
MQSATSAKAPIATSFSDFAEARAELEGGGGTAALRGLQNHGNTCYMNSVLQALFATREFRSWLLADPEGLAETSLLAAELRRLFAGMYCSVHSALSTKSLMQNGFGWASTKSAQQDAQEFANSLLNALMSVEAKPSTVSGAVAGGTMVKQLFCGKLQHVIHCDRCAARQDRPDNFLDLVVDIQAADTLDGAIAALAQPAPLDDYWCEHCGESGACSMFIEIVTLPPILMITVQQYDFDVKTMSRVKISKPFAFGRELQLSPVASTSDGANAATQVLPHEYALYAAVMHKGKGAGRGHYTCIGTSDTPGADPHWYHFDDTKITEADDKMADVTAPGEIPGEPELEPEPESEPGPVQSRGKRTPEHPPPSPYILFYRRIGGGVSTAADTCINVYQRRGRLPAGLAAEITAADEARWPRAVELCRRR